jgi:hypothetical protein
VATSRTPRTLSHSLVGYYDRKLLFASKVRAGLTPHFSAELVEWTRDGLLRHPQFIGIRTDKPPRDVKRDA